WWRQAITSIGRNNGPADRRFPGIATNPGFVRSRKLTEGEHRMTSRDFNSQAASKNFAFTVICLFTLVLLATLELDSQQLQKGVSVELAPTTSAKPIPD